MLGAGSDARSVEPVPAASNLLVVFMAAIFFLEVEAPVGREDPLVEDLMTGTRLGRKAGSAFGEDRLSRAGCFASPYNLAVRSVGVEELAMVTKSAPWRVKDQDHQCTHHVWLVV